MKAYRALRVTLAVLLTGLCFLISTGVANACSCGDAPSPSVALAQSSKVFSGKVVHVSDGGGTERQPALLSGYILVEFEVYSVWKGQAYATMFIETAWWSGSCGVEFYLGQEWLVYSYDGETTHPCSRTRPLELAQADLDELGEGQVPVPGTIEPYQQSGDRIERTRSPAAVADAPTPAASPLQDVIPAWLSLALLIVVVVAVLGWALRGTTRKAQAVPARGRPLRSGRQSRQKYGDRPRR